MVAVSEKDVLYDAQKHLGRLPQPVGAAERPKRSLVRRLIRTALTLFAVYQVHSLLKYLTRSFHYPGLTDTEYLVRPGHGPILVGRRAEEAFLKVPDELSALEASRLYARLAHMAGTDQDLETAKYVLQHFENSFNIERDSEDPIFPAGSPESRSAILDIDKTTEPRAWIDIYYPVLSTPGERVLEVKDEDGNVVWTADIEEHGDPLDEDATNALPEAPVFHGLSKGGDVTGELVYANYCRLEDFEAVERAGGSFNGKIVLCRYGELFRGLKVKGAQERGAVGTLIYSDTRDDGSVTVENGYEPYPIGPARNPTSVQRGSVQFLSIYPGDPTTPGYPSYKNSSRTEGTNIPSIPSLPISSANAKKLLEVTGKNDTKRVVRLLNEANHDVTPIWNTMAVIPGHIKNEVVVIGNHRDAWVLGATDPSSGTVSVHEVVRGFAKLWKLGWRPLRTILLASWDAEEYGLIGSTEWAEDFPEWIQDNVVAYINLDSSVSGSRFTVGGSPSMAHLLRNVALNISHPTDPTRALWDARSDDGPFGGSLNAEIAAKEAAKVNDEPGLGVHPLGSGSDYTAFLQRLGVASSDGGFGRTNTDAVYHYHSIYDSQRSQEVYLDPGFHRHVAVAKYVGLTALRLSSSVILPLNTTFYSEQLSRYVDQVADIMSTADVSIDLSPLRDAVKKVQKASLNLDKEKEEAEKVLWKIINKIRHRHPHHPHHALPPPPPQGHPHPPPLPPHVESRSLHVEERQGPCSMRHFRGYINTLIGMNAEEEGFAAHWPYPPSPPSPDHPHPPPSPDYPVPARPPHHRPHPPHKLIKAIKRVQAVNKKLSKFESGFISEEGLLDREWYKHLGVAPGKWLGYGATTLPGLTEAFTIERNSTLAEHEVKRLTTLLKKLAKHIDV